MEKLTKILFSIGFTWGHTLLGSIIYRYTSNDGTHYKVTFNNNVDDEHKIIIYVENDKNYFDYKYFLSYEDYLNQCYMYLKEEFNYVLRKKKIQKLING